MGDITYPWVRARGGDSAAIDGLFSGRERRGGEAVHETLNTTLSDGPPAGDEQIVQVQEASEQLAHREPHLVQVAEMRHFVGLSGQEIAEGLDSTERTVRRDRGTARRLPADSLRD
jgi:DNA-directed RNA polymerase specialized sigma24 family protein